MQTNAYLRYNSVIHWDSFINKHCATFDKDLMKYEDCIMSIKVHVYKYSNGCTFFLIFKI